MYWLDHTPEELSAAAIWPQLTDVVVAAAPVQDHLHALLPLELLAVERAVTKRRWEFATGRQLARQAMQALDLTPGPIGKASDRSPVWPAHCLGSITHAGQLAVAAVARRGALSGIGVDLEEADRVTPGLRVKLLTSLELRRLPGQDERAAGLIFSAKEAAYTAGHPIVGKFIGFQEVEIDVDWPAGRFTVRYVGEHGPNRVLDSGEGYFGFAAQYVLTLFIIR
jgi:4'-phosphopantetheinyl transferase EntD